MLNLISSVLKQIIPFFIFIVVFNSCTSEFKPVIFKTTSIDIAYEADISIEYDKAIGNDELSKTVNFNVEKSIIGTLNNAEKKTSLNAVLEDFNSEFVAFKRGFPDASEPVWELYIETEKTYQSEDLITIAISTYEFKGGAHGNDKIKFINLNAKTGDIIDRDAIIEDIEGFKKLANTYFIKSLDTEDKDQNMEDLFFGKPFQLPENIGYSDDGLILLYNVYEVASYDQGYTEFVIPFDEANTYLKFN